MPRVYRCARSFVSTLSLLLFLPLSAAVGGLSVYLCARGFAFAHANVSSRIVFAGREEEGGEGGGKRRRLEWNSLESLHVFFIVISCNCRWLTGTLRKLVCLVYPVEVWYKQDYYY